MAESEKPTYELGKFSRPSAQFPHGQWCIYVKREGKKRQRYGLGISLTESRTRAQARMSEWIRRRERALFDEGTQTIGEIMELYFANRLREGKSVAKEQRLWRAKMAPLFADRKPEDLNMPEMVDGEERTLPHKYAWLRAQDDRRRATIHHELNILRTGMNWAIKQKMIAPVAVWLPRRAKPRDTRMTFEELLRLLDECKAVHLKLFVVLAISTGARKTAILQLTWDRVDLDRRVINFNVDRDQDNILDSSGRKGRAVVDMEDAAHQALTIAKRWRTTDHVIEWNGKPVKDVHQALKRAMKRAGIEGKFFGAHAIRHSVATMIADAGVDLRKVQRLLGHEDFSTTDKIYASHSRGYLSDAVRVVDGFLPKMEPDAELGSGEILEGGTKKHVSPGSSNLRPKL